MSQIEGVIFDLDNTLVFSEELQYEAIKEVVAEIFVELEWDFYKQEYLGHDIRTIFRSILAHLDTEITEEKVNRLVAEQHEEFKAILKEKGVKQVAGAKEFLDSLKVANIPFTIASSSLKENIEAVLYQAGLIDYFTKLVTVWDVKKPKPAPDIFVEAARLLTADIKKCVIFEDSYQGITGAVESGGYTVGLTTTYAAAGVALAGAHKVIKDFTEVPLEKLEAEFTDWATKSPKKK